MATLPTQRLLDKLPKELIRGRAIGTKRLAFIPVPGISHFLVRVEENEGIFNILIQPWEKGWRVVYQIGILAGLEARLAVLAALIMVDRCIPKGKASSEFSRSLPACNEFPPSEKGLTIPMIDLRPLDHRHDLPGVSRPCLSRIPDYDYMLEHVVTCQRHWDFFD